MAKGIYFIEPNQRFVSDFEAYFLIKPNYNLIGCSGMLSTALEQIKSNPAVDAIIIAQNMPDGDCISALQQLAIYPALKIVGVDKSDEMLQNQIRSLGGIPIIKPYSFSDIDAILSRELSGNGIQAPTYDNEANASTLPTSQLTQETPETPPIVNDNPYLAQAIRNREERGPDVKERLRQVRRERGTAGVEHLIPQQVIAVHNQKGGVGKTTIAKELAIAIQRFTFVKGGENKHPKVCLCDFDLDASDIASVLNLPPRPNIFDWHTDLYAEAQRIKVSSGKTEPIQNIRFPERQIMENYLLRHESGIYVLVAPETKQESTEIHKEDVQAIIANLRACDFDVIILDTGPNILDYTLTSLLEADTILAVSTCELVSVRRLNSIIQDLIRVPGCNPSKIKLVVNSYDSSSNITPQEIVDVLHLELAGIIPKYDEVGNLNNESYSIFYGKAKDKRSAQVYAECINRLAKKVTHVDEMASRQPSQRQGNGEPQKLKRHSIWQRLFG